MAKKLAFLFSFIILFIASICNAQQAGKAPLNIVEQDGSPSTYPYKLKVSNGSLTDNGDGTASLTTGGVSSQWTTAGSDIYYSTGNVGIGTTAPVKRLDIKSSGTDDGIQVLSSTNSAIIQLREQSTTAGRFLLGSSTTQSDCISSGDCNWKNSGNFIYSPSSTERFRVTSTGNVGIGTSNPQGALVVTNGNVGIGTWTSSALLHVVQPGVGDAFRVDDAAGGDTTPFMIDSVGNVGIGTVVTTDRLFTVDSSGSGLGNRFSISVGGSGSSNRDLNFQPFATGASGQGGWNIQTLINNSQNGGGTTLALQNLAGNVGIATFHANALLDISSTAAQDLFRVNDNGSGDTTPFLIDSVGNVGIGTTVLDGLFVVPSGVKIGTPGASTAALIIKGGTTGSNLLEMQRTSGATITYGWSLAGGGLSFQDVTNAVSPFGIYADVGINHLTFGVRNQTTTDTRPSRISGTSFNSGTDVNGTELQIYGSLGTGAGTPGDINFYTGNTAASSSTTQSGTIKATIKATSGNIGIATVTPVALLDISSTAAQNLFMVNDNGNADLSPFVIASDGNVGIGTTSPAANLQISGSANTVHLIVKSSASQSPPFNDVEFQSSSGVARLKFYDLNNSPRIMYDYSGSNGGDFTGQLNGVDQMSFGFNNAGSFGGSAGVASGRLIYFYDRVSDAYRGAINASGDFYWGTTTSAFSVKLTAPASGSIPIAVRGSAGQTANLQEWQNSSGTVLSAFNPNGNVGIGTSVPTAKLVVGSNGHILSQASSSPTLSSCGTSPSITTGSTDSVGEITVGTGTITSCTLTFVTAFDRAPHCFIQGNTTSNKTYAVTNTTTTMVISSGSAFDTEVIDYLCIGN